MKRTRRAARARLRFHWAAFAALAVPTGLAAQPAPGPPDPIGWIAHITNNDPDLRLLRGGEALSFAVGTALAAGDTFRLPRADAAVEIVLVNGARRTVTPASAGAALRIEGEEPTMRGRLFAEFFHWFEDGGGRREYAGSRGDPAMLEILPGLVSGAAKLAAGRRTLIVTWVGAEAPFSVRVVNRRTGAAVLTSADVFSREVQAEVELAAGEYLIEVAGAGARGSFEFAAVPASDLPVLVVDADHDLDAFETTIRAYELANAGTGEWALEALQLAYPAARERYRPALELIRAIEERAAPSAAEPPP